MTRYDLRAEVPRTSGSSSAPHCPFCGSRMGRFRGEYQCPRCFVEVRSSTFDMLGTSAKRESAASCQTPQPDRVVKREPVTRNRLLSSESRQQSFLSFLETLRGFSAS
jgi:uncharacterized Zn finger protein (UPF0148 family)